MARYGQDFGADRFGGSGSGSGQRGGQGFGFGGRAGGGAFGEQNNESFGGRGGGFGGGRGRMGGGGYGREMEDFGGGRQGGFRGGRGGMERGGEFGGGMGYGGGRQGGFGGEGMGYGGGGYGGGQFGQQDDSSRVRASEIMTENPETVTPDASLADAARKMRDLNVGIIPVVESQENRRLRGVITDRDIAVRAVAEGRDVSSTKVSDVMTTEIETCNKNDSVRNVLEVMQREQVRRVPITDREGRLVGIIAQADVAVDYLESRPSGKREVARTLQQVSEPGAPASGGQGKVQGAQNRGTAGAAARPSQQRNEE